MNRSVLVTGAAGGLGGATAEVFAERGWQVFAADLHPPQAAPGKVPVQLDVTDSASVDAAAELIASHIDGLGAVVNFAGVLEVGRAWMEVPEDRVRLSFEVNVVGTYLVNKSMFSLVRAGGGRIVNISSAAALIPPMPMSGPYAVSKIAVEAYSDALRRELMFVGVPVIVVAPGTFRSNMTSSINEFFTTPGDVESPFAPLRKKVGELVAKQDAEGLDARVLAEAVWGAVNSPKPKARYAVHVGRERHVLNRIPHRLLDRITRARLG